MFNTFIRPIRRGSRLFPLALTLLAVVPWASAWDAGPAQCKHSECLDGIYPAYGSNWSGNTHLWLVNRAIEQLQQLSTGTGAEFIAGRLNEPACRERWESGLWDTDDKWVDAGKYPGSHFYNPQHKWWDGTTTKASTYLVLGTDQGWYWENDNAKEQAQSRIAAAGGLMSGEQCYQLGRALHYLTDMTQPMHTTSFSGLTYPPQLHPVWEMYVVPLAKGLTPAPFANRFQSGTTCANPNNCTPYEIFELTAWRTTDLWPKDIMTILTAGEGCTYTFSSYNTTGSCFRAYAPGDVLAKKILADAVPSVTAYLLSLKNVISFVSKTGSCGGKTYGLTNTSNGPIDRVFHPIRRLDGNNWSSALASGADFAVGGPNCEIWTMTDNGVVGGPTNNKVVLAKAKYLSIGGNGDVWMIDEADIPAKLNRTEMQFYEPPGIPRTKVSRIAVGLNGELYAVDASTYLVMKLNPSQNQWNATTGSGTAREISVDSDGRLWAIGTAVQDRDRGWSTQPGSDDQGPFRANYNIQVMSTAGVWTVTDGSATDIDAGGATMPLVLTRQGGLWRRNATTWERVPMPVRYE